MTFNSVIPKATNEGLWRLQDTSGPTATDDSGKGRAGTIVGATLGIDGPNDWLPKGFGFDGSDDDVNLPTPWMNGSTPMSWAGWVKFLGDANFLGSASGFEFALRRNSGNVQFILNSLGGANDRVTAGAVATGEWVFIGGSWGGPGGSLKAYIEATNSSVSTSGNHASVGNVLIAGFDANNYEIEAGGLFAFSEQLTDAEFAQLRLGPEPVNSVAPTLTIDGSSWSGTVGTWGLDAPFSAGSNGAITYAWELRDADDDLVVESGSGSSPSGSGSYSGDYYLSVRASNAGGFDPDADTVSATETAGAGAIVIPPPLLFPMTCGI